MKRITGRFVLLIATAAVLPLLLYGLISVTKLTDSTEQSVTLGNQALAQQIAAQITLYFNDSHRVLLSIAENCGEPSSNIGSKRKSCAITSSIFQSSARFPCSTRRAG